MPRKRRVETMLVRIGLRRRENLLEDGKGMRVP